MLKIKIDFKSFFQRGIKCVDDNFGIFLITGYQGSGKTWYSIYLMEKEKIKLYIPILNHIIRLGIK